MGVGMTKRSKISPEETAELQRLYSELPWAIAEAAKTTSAEQPVDQAQQELQDGDEKVDTIIKRICQLTDDLDDTSD
jgi:hypothetical protein